jgi:hypothetical protein
MKEIKLFILVLLLGAIFISCEDSTTDPIPTTGTIYVESDPTGAEIWLDDVNTGVVTPGRVDADPGAHIVTLKKAGYGDLSINVGVTAGEEFVLTSGTTLSLLGSLVINSQPAGAEIWIDGANTDQVTPSSFSLPDANYTVYLDLADYSDTTFVTQIANGGTTTETIELRPEFLASLSASIWETIGTTSEQPSGLDLSTGAASSIASGVNLSVDVFYSSDGFVVMSANGRNGMTRETYFKIGNGTELNDGINSPIKDNSWVTSILDTETNYIFLYDADGNYSKFRIVNQSGGTPGNPSKLDVQWLYNPKQNDINF